MNVESQKITSNLIELDLMYHEIEDEFLDWIFDEQLIQEDSHVLDEIHEFTKTGVIL